MSLNDTPSADRIHIGIFGRRNAGKSSLMNAVTSQNLAIVSEKKGTTTDPVRKSMELLPLGPVVIIDTPGLDDNGELGKLRVKKSYQMLNKTDVALLVIDGDSWLNSDSEESFTEIEKRMIKRFHEKEISYLIVVNKEDLLTEKEKNQIGQFIGEPEKTVFVSAKEQINIQNLKEKIATILPGEDTRLKLAGDLLEPEDLAVLVVPIDSAAPKGRLILPQQQVIRDCLEAGAIPVIVRESEFPRVLDSLKKKPKVVITDSQVFGQVNKDTPKDIYLTSFSILLSRYKGNLFQQVKGANALDTLRAGDKVLICEGCTHHRQCGDIGTVKLPRWLYDYTKKNLDFTFKSGTEFPDDLTEYALVIHCGGCTLNGREMKYRLKCAEEANIPITNYGIIIAKIHGILERSIEIFHSKNLF